ncbi:unnamed protein product, partial [Rotaria magnacalcarata]
CNPNPCLNNGRCIALNGNIDFYCVCPTDIPVGGKRCDQLLLETTTTYRPTTLVTPSPCASYPCLNNGVCTVSQFGNTYTCTCGAYFYGVRCEHQNRCSYQPELCQNGATCVPGIDGAYSCRCTSSYSGANCQQFNPPTGICSSMPCKNGATCVALNNNANYHCTCPAAYTGSTCSNPKTTCPEDYCTNNGQCTFDYTLNRLRCACPGTFSGQFCEIPIGKLEK